MIDRIKKLVQSSITVKQELMASDELMKATEAASEEVVTALKGGGQVLFCGNGGSAADAQHLAAELSGRFYHDREPLNAEALHVNTSYLTAVANDYSYDEVYSRLIKAKGKKGSLLFCISTSGNSKNVVEAAKEAKLRGMRTIAMTGAKGGVLKDICDIVLNVPSNDTPRIQECHILLGHIICELSEEGLM